MPCGAVIVIARGPRGRCQRGGAELVSSPAPNDLLARSLRAPDILDAVKRVRASGAPERVTCLNACLSKDFSN